MTPNFTFQRPPTDDTEKGKREKVTERYEGVNGGCRKRDGLLL